MSPVEATVVAEVEVIRPIVSALTQDRDAWLANLGEAYPEGTSLERRLAAAVAIFRLSATADGKHTGFSFQAGHKILQSGARGDAALAFVDAVQNDRDVRRRDTTVAGLLPLSPPPVLAMLTAVLRQEMSQRSKDRGAAELDELHAVWSALPQTFTALLGMLGVVPLDQLLRIAVSVGPHCFHVRGPVPGFGALQAMLGHLPAEALALQAAVTGRDADCRDVIACIEASNLHVPVRPGGPPRPWVGLFWPPHAGPPGPDGRPAFLPSRVSMEALVSWGAKHRLPSDPAAPVPLPPRIFLAAALSALGNAKKGWAVLTGGLPEDDRPLFHPLGLAMATAKITGFVRFCSSTRKGHPTLAGFVQRTCPAVVHTSGLVVGASSSRDDAKPLDAKPLDADAGSPLRWLDLDATRASARAHGCAFTPPHVKVAMVQTAGEARAAAEIIAAARVIGLDCEWAPTPLPLAPAVLDRVLGAVDADARSSLPRPGVPPRQTIRCVEAARLAGLAPPTKFPVSLAQICTGSHGFLVDPILVALDAAGDGREALRRVAEAVGTFEGGEGEEGVIVGFGLDTDYSMLSQSLRDVGATKEGLLPVDLMATLPGPGLRHAPRRDQLLISQERKAGVSELVRRAISGDGGGAEDTAAAGGAGAASASGAGAEASASEAVELAGATARSGSSGHATAGSAPEEAAPASGGIEAALDARTALDKARPRRARAFADLQLGSWMMSLGGTRSGRPQVSLSELSAVVLGEPLDKSCQVSDWDRRPLTSFQALYAITDAYVPVVAFEKAMEAHGSAE